MCALWLKSCVSCKTGLLACTSVPLTHFAWFLTDVTLPATTQLTELGSSCNRRPSDCVSDCVSVSDSVGRGRVLGGCRYRDAKVSKSRSD